MMLQRLLLLAWLLIVPVPSWAAIAFDAPGTNGRSTTDTLTYAHTVSGSDRALYVCIQGQKAGGADNVSSVTYNGVSATFLARTAAYNTNYKLEVWRLVAPATGANNVVITYPATQTEIIGTSASYTGVDQTTPDDTPATNTAESDAGPITVNVSSASGDVVIDCASPHFALTVPTVGASQTKRSELNDTASSGSWVGLSEEAGAGTVTMSWTLTTTPRSWGTIGVNLNAASGGGGGSTARTLMLLGVGQ